MWSTLIIDVLICVTLESPFFSLLPIDTKLNFNSVSNAPQFSFSYCFAQSIYFSSLQTLQVFSILSALQQKSEHVYIKSFAACFLVNMSPINLCIACILWMSCSSQFLYTSVVISFKIALCRLIVHIRVSAVLGFLRTHSPFFIVTL